MAGSPRGASCLPCTAEGLEGSVWKLEGGVGDWYASGGVVVVVVVFLRSLPGLLLWQQLCKIASSALVVTVGFLSLSLSLSLALSLSAAFPPAQHGEAHLAPPRLGLIRTQSNGPFPLCCVLFYPFFFSFFFSLPVFLFSSSLFLSCPRAPIHHGG